MTEQERLKTLENLKLKKKEIMYEIERLPIGFRTLATEAKRNLYFDKLSQLENAIQTFSKSNVYISLNN